MKIILKDIEYHKSCKSTQKIIYKGIMKLHARLSEYAKNNNINVSNIFNDDVLVHDIINKNFYVFKCRIDKVQLRLLYTVYNNELIIISHYFKKRNSKEYMVYFKKLSDNINIE